MYMDHEYYLILKELEEKIMRVVIDVTNAQKEPGGMLFAARAL